MRLRLDRLLGDRGRRRGAAPARRAARRRRPAEIDAVLARRGGRRSVGARRARRRSAAGPVVGLAGLVNVLNPRLVVFGGLFGRLFPFTEPRPRAELDRLRPSRATRRLVGIVPSRSATMRRVIGAAELAFEPFLADPARWLRRRRGLLERASA